MKRFRATTLFTLIILIAAIGYIAYQMTANLTQQIRTVDAMEVTVEEKISARGVFIREQMILTGGGGKTAEYLVEDGEKVSVGQRLAVFFQGEDARQAFDRASQLREQLTALEYAYSMITSGVDSRKMDSLIFDRIAAGSEKLAGGEAARVTGDYSALQQLVVSRGATEEDKAAFEEQIAQLKKEIRACQDQYDQSSSSLWAPDTGYFVSGLDGLESVLTVDGLDSLTPADLDGPQAEPQEGLGTISTGFSWYYALTLSKEQADKLQQRKTLDIYFPELSAEKLTVKIYRLETYPDGRAVLILKSERMDPMYLTAREQDIDIVVDTYTGLKVPSQALRQQEGEWGVFVLDGSIASFKPVTWTYSTESYFLVPCASSAKEGLYRYDRIITQGKNLADNKVIQ